MKSESGFSSAIFSQPFDFDYIHNLFLDFWYLISILY